MIEPATGMLSSPSAERITSAAAHTGEMTVPQIAKQPDRQQRTQEIASVRWGGVTLDERLGVLRRAREQMATMGAAFASAISPALVRTEADTLATELLPLLDACRFLEREAPVLLAPRKLYSEGRPWWLRRVEAEVWRVPLGRVLVIAPSNFPLFLPGVQALQALAAGNGVTWKPGRGGRKVADLFAGAMRDAGLPAGVLRITEDTVAAGSQALRAGADKVVFTGSAAAGRAVMHECAEAMIPSVMELSGCDAVLVLPGADLERVAKAVAFGLRLNGSAVCMSPRRLLALGDTMRALKPLLVRELAAVPAVALDADNAPLLQQLVDEAVTLGAHVSGELNPAAQKPLLLDGTGPHMRVTCTDIFAPVLSLMTSSQIAKMQETLVECGYSLTVAIFGPEDAARNMAAEVRAGTVLINDLIVPTADPRVPFGGVAASGFGVTRGAEGLLEMTAVKTLLTRHGSDTRHYEPADETHRAMFDGALRGAHARGWKARLQGIRDAVTTAKQLKAQETKRS
jgi:acyl-CoA reductase-like NAD-dependent aldehyde dehydrogenase